MFPAEGGVQGNGEGGSMSGTGRYTTPVADLLRLDGKVAVVTGAAKGIGQAIAARLAEGGAAVLATDVDLDALDATIHGLGESCLAMPLDVGEPSQVNAV